jgi:hypothetical protein
MRRAAACCAEPTEARRTLRQGSEVGEIREIREECASVAGCGSGQENGGEEGARQESREKENAGAKENGNSSQENLGRAQTECSLMRAVRLRRAAVRSRNNDDGRVAA